MEQPSELETFLNAHSSEGQLESAGEFTIARDKALAKLAEFQLPFEGAWAIKVLQAAVASGVEKAIRVDLTTKEARFYFPITERWTLEAIETHFYDPEPGPDRAMNHLASALWAVGINQKRGFQLAIPGTQETLIWDGSSLNRVETKQRYDCIFLGVAHEPTGSGTLNWVKGIAKSGSRNAGILKALSEYCYTSPVPLTVDGRRVDSLQLCPYHGWSKTSFPISMNFVSGDLPEFPISPGTFEDLRSYMEKKRDGGGVEAVGNAMMKAIPTTSHASLATLVTAHMEQVRRGKHTYWEPAHGYSKCYWVQDGAVVDEEDFDTAAASCTVGSFVSAQGLATDLTGLHLAQSTERTSRKVEAAKLTQRTLLELDGLPFETMISKGRTQGRVLGGVLCVLGIGTMWASPAHGIGLLVGGGVSFFTAGQRQEKLALALKNGLHNTTNALGRRYLR